MKRFPSKMWHLNFSFLPFAKFAIFAKFLKHYVLSFLLMSGPCVTNGKMIIRITLNQNFLVHRKFKSPFGGSTQIFINISICK